MSSLAPPSGSQNNRRVSVIDKKRQNGGLQPSLLVPDVSAALPPRKFSRMFDENDTGKPPIPGTTSNHLKAKPHVVVTREEMARREAIRRWQNIKRYVVSFPLIWFYIRIHSSRLHILPLLVQIHQHNTSNNGPNRNKAFINRCFLNSRRRSNRT